MFYIGETVVVTHIIGEDQQSTAQSYVGKEGVVTNIDTGTYPITVRFAPEMILGFMIEELEPVDANTEIESEESLVDLLSNT